MFKKVLLSLVTFCVISSINTLDAQQTMHLRRIASTGLSRPVFGTTAPGDATRMFIVELKEGEIRIVNLADGTVNPTPFLKITDLEVAAYEQGLLGLAFHPDYDTNGRFFVNYTNAAGDTVVEEYLRQTPDLADPNSGKVIISYDQPLPNHNGGWMAFRNGLLFISSGDGGGQFDPLNNSQQIENNLLGKILRIDVDGDDFPEDDNRNYAIPPSNPFVGQVGDDEIWVYGLRNPWRCSFDRANGDLYIGEVGQDQFEEVNFQPGTSTGGENFGWKIREGTAGPTLAGAIEPMFAYEHDDDIPGNGGDETVIGNAVTGGYVYRGPIPEIQGHYFFCDFRAQRFYSMKYDGTDPANFDGTNVIDIYDWTPFMSVDAGELGRVASYAEDQAGNLYFIDITGELFVLDSVGEVPSTATFNITPTNKGIGVTDAATGSGFIMYSEEPVQTRLPGVSEFNANHLIAVRVDCDQWQYNDNRGNSLRAWRNFEPRETDRLLAEVDFDADTVIPLESLSFSLAGISAGYNFGDITFIPNEYNGRPNTGEFDVSGTSFSVDPLNLGISIGEPNKGIGVTDSATGSGYFMYSEMDVHDRFTDVVPTSSADHVIAVRLDGLQWQYNNNRGNLAAAWIDFTPADTDHLLAIVDFSSDIITPLENQLINIGGIDAGYADSDLRFVANEFNGRPNVGEFGLLGSYFIPLVGQEGTCFTPTNRGILVTDFANGSGYVMYSEEMVQTRFSEIPSHAADHLIMVRFDGDSWQYNDNRGNQNFAWVDFTPTASDRLLAAVDFDADSVQMLVGQVQSINGIEAGFSDSNLIITPNQYNGTNNFGEFGVSGSYFID